MTEVVQARRSEDLNTQEMQRRVNALRPVDNLTSWLYLLREYAFLTSVIGLTLAFYHFRAGWGLAWQWNVPVGLLGVVLIGAGQHRLTTLGHEASHYSLFRNRMLNEVVSDWFCMYFMYSTTQQYRLQHLAHHQFPNDPDRDPDVAQLEQSGHRYRFPMARWLFMWKCVLSQVLWLPGLVRYTRMRAHYAVTGAGSGPYSARRPASPILIRVGAVLTLLLAASSTTVAYLQDPWLLGLMQLALYLPAISFFLVRTGAFLPVPFY